MGSGDGDFNLEQFLGTIGDDDDRNCARTRSTSRCYENCVVHYTIFRATRKRSKSDAFLAWAVLYLPKKMAEGEKLGVRCKSVA